MSRNFEPQKTPSEIKLDKIDNRDKLVRAVELIVLAVLVCAQLASTVALQNVINENQKRTVAARAANAQRQQEQKDYIKCIILLKYDAPNLNAQSTRSDVETALDNCATKTNKD